MEVQHFYGQTLPLDRIGRGFCRTVVIDARHSCKNVQVTMFGVQSEYRLRLENGIGQSAIPLRFDCVQRRKQPSPVVAYWRIENAQVVRLFRTAMQRRRDS